MRSAAWPRRAWVFRGRAPSASSTWCSYMRAWAPRQPRSPRTPPSRAQPAAGIKNRPSSRIVALDHRPPVDLHVRAEHSVRRGEGLVRDDDIDIGARPFYRVQIDHIFADPFAPGVAPAGEEIDHAGKAGAVPPHEHQRMRHIRAVVQILLDQFRMNLVAAWRDQQFLL